MGIPMRALLLSFAILASLYAASANDRSFTGSATLTVGQTSQIVVFGGHSADCRTSELGKVVVIEAPQKGSVALRANAPYVAQNSLSHTCEGMPFEGTAVDYTAKAPGKDRVKLDAIFPNGTAHWVISITVR
jgi:hypothetical protein